MHYQMILAGPLRGSELLESSLCLPGLIYDGRVVQGDVIHVAVRISSGGYCTISVRDITTGRSWTNYSLLSSGNKVRFS